MDGQLIAEVAPLGDPDRVDLADQVRDRRVGCGELLRVALLGGQPRQLGGVAVLGDEVAAAAADRRVRVVVDLASGDRRDGVVEQRDERADEPGLGLAALAEQHHVLAGEDRVLDLRDDRIVVAADPAEQLLVVAQLADEVAAKLGSDR